MGVLHCLFFLKLIIHINAIKSKSVNLALETVLEFNHEDKGNDVKFLDNVHEFIDRIKSAMGTNKTARRFESENKNIKFTGFLKSAIDTLKSYDDDDLEDVFAVLNEEIRKYHYRGCKFYELVEDRKIRRFVANKLDDIKDKPARELRKNLDYAIQAIENSKFSIIPTEFFDFVNSIYGQDSSNKLKAFLNNLQSYSSKSKRTNLDLIKVVRDGLRSVIFDHYSALNPNARRDLKIKLETSWRNLSYPERVEHNVWTVKYTTAHTKDFQKRTTSGLELKLTEEKQNVTKKEPSVSFELSNFEKTSPHNTRNLRHKKHRDVEDVYFVGKAIEDATVKKKSTRSPVEAKLFNSERSLSSELLHMVNEDESTSYYKPIQRPVKSTGDDEKTKVLPKNLKPKNMRHALKSSSFIASYPEEIAFNGKKPSKLKSLTRKPTLYTLWEEKITQKGKKGLKLRTPKSKAHLRTNINKHRVIAETDTVINVEKAAASSVQDDSSQNGQLLANSEMKFTEYPTRRQTEITESNYKPTTHMKFRKHMPKATTPEEGFSIESSEISRRSMREKHINDDPPQIVLKGNVLRRINNLEKQMEEVKGKLDKTKLTTEKNKLKVIEFETTTTASTTTHNITYNRTSITILNTKLSTKSIKDSITVDSNQFDTKNNSEMRSNSNEITTAQTSNKIANVTINEGMTTDSAHLTNVNVSLSEEANNERFLMNLEHPTDDLGIDKDKDLDKIMKKYNINAKSDKMKPFGVDELMAESENPSGKAKATVVKNIVENDMKLLSRTSKDPNELVDPFGDLNDLDWMGH